MAADGKNRKATGQDAARAILVALQQEERRRREGLRIGLGFILMTAGVLCALALGMLKGWELVYMLIVSLILGIALFVVGQALGILIGEMIIASRRMDAAVNALARLAEKALEKQNAQPEGAPKQAMEGATKALDNR
jgi:hypothetical protein